MVVLCFYFCQFENKIISFNYSLDNFLVLNLKIQILILKNNLFQGHLLFPYRPSGTFILAGRDRFHTCFSFLELMPHSKRLAVRFALASSDCSPRTPPRTAALQSNVADERGRAQRRPSPQAGKRVPAPPCTVRRLARLARARWPPPIALIRKTVYRREEKTGIALFSC